MQKLIRSDEHWGVHFDSSSTTAFWFWGECFVALGEMKIWLERD